MKVRRYICFDFDDGKIPEGTTWLQITSVSNIGSDEGIRQKIIRLGPEHQAELYRLLRAQVRAGTLKID